VNQHASYIYLGAEGVRLPAIEEPRTTVLIHGKLDDPIPVTKRDGRIVDSVALADAAGGASVASRRYAEWVLPQSRKVIEAARTGGPLPDRQLAIRDVRLLGEAMRAYAREHEDHLPPDLGAVFPYVGAGAEPPLSPADKARVYLSPRAERITTPPDDADADWALAHCSYGYVGAADLTLSAVRKQVVVTLLHGPLDETYPVLIGDREHQMIPYFDAAHVRTCFAEGIQEQIEETRTKLDAARKTAPAR
jgi:hypothetical protein